MNTQQRSKYTYGRGNSVSRTPSFSTLARRVRGRTATPCRSGAFRSEAAKKDDFK